MHYLLLLNCYLYYYFELLTFQFDVLNLRLSGMNTEQHWMHLLFIAHALIDFQIIDKAVQIYDNILNIDPVAYQRWPYLHSQLAIAHHNKRGKNGKVIHI